MNLAEQLRESTLNAAAALGRLVVDDRDVELRAEARRAQSQISDDHRTLQRRCGSDVMAQLLALHAPQFDGPYTHEAHCLGCGGNEHPCASYALISDALLGGLA